MHQYGVDTYNPYYNRSNRYRYCHRFTVRSDGILGIEHYHHQWHSGVIRYI
jgi:hypothetical protein